MAVAFVQYKYTHVTSAAIVPTLTSNPTVGNLLVAMVTRDSAAGGFGIHAGWTQIDAVTGSQPGITAYRVVASGDTTSNLPAIATGTDTVHISCWEVSGQESGAAAIAAHGMAGGSGSTLAVSATPSVANTLLLTGAGTTTTNLTTPPVSSPSTTFTTDQANIAGSGGHEAAAAHSSYSGTSAITTTWTQSGNNNIRVAVVLVAPLVVVANVDLTPSKFQLFDLIH